MMGDQQDLRLIDRMGQPDFYPHPTGATIVVEQTHISYIFLTGEFAYKVKKAVNFGFLDFSTLPQRQQFCQAELELNQQLSQDLYLEVVALNKDGDHYGINGPGIVVDYAIKMRQFDQQQLLSHVFERGELTLEHLQSLAKIVAQFHQQAPTNDYITKFGAVAQIAQGINHNYDHTEKYIGSLQTPQQEQETRAFTDRFLQDHRSVFAQRQYQGKIKECHGDLHLANLCLWRGRVQPFDRIEFNEPFRFVDTMYDIAFTVMDLDAKGRPDLAMAFLNHYLEQTGDWHGLRVLPFYLCRQAYVRAKVNSLTSDDPQVDEAKKATVREQASHYYRLAWEYGQRPTGQIWLMCGVSGSGKSTIARELALAHRGVHLRSDAVRKHLAGLDPQTAGPKEIYTPAMTKRTYDELLSLAQMIVHQGFNVILDAKYDRVELRAAVIDWALTQGIKIHLVPCTAPPDILKQRLRDRVGDISDATEAMVPQQLEQWEPLTTQELSLVGETNLIDNI